MKKDLSNYFDDWVTVDATVKNAVELSYSSERDKWCSQNIGMKGLKWHAQWKTFDNPNPSIRSKVTNRWCYMFKTEQDAMMFVLTWGGKVIRNNNLE